MELSAISVNEVSNIYYEYESPSNKENISPPPEESTYVYAVTQNMIDIIA